jgi:rRNA-processing protein FCF1
MKVLMDADCLIKLTKSGLKEPICRSAEVAIPRTVQREVVEAGRLKGQPDADLVDQNIRDGLITVVEEESSPHHSTGDQALVDVFKEGRYAVIATDDAKLIRGLRSAGIPFTVPALLIHAQYEKGEIDRKTALQRLEALSVFISDEEYSVTKLLLEERA